MTRDVRHAGRSVIHPLRIKQTKVVVYRDRSDFLEMARLAICTVVIITSTSRYSRAVRTIICDLFAIAFTGDVTFLDRVVWRIPENVTM